MFKYILLFFIFAASLLADVWVNGYTRSDGTYVPGHYRSSPDSSYNNNWGVQGNKNPYTGAYGTKPRTYNDKYPNSSGSNILNNYYGR